jgi:catechol-2,3-dioxygenase
VYFHGPEEILLEFIARQADAEIPGGTGPVPRPLSISEVGIGVPDVGAAVSELTDTLGLPTFPPQEAQFAPVGNHDGLLILVDHERVWFPTRTHQAARGPLTARIHAPKHSRDVAITAYTTITAAA